MLQIINHDEFSSAPDVVLKSHHSRKKASRRSGKYTMRLKNKKDLKVKKRKFADIKHFQQQVSTTNSVLSSLIAG